MSIKLECTRCRATSTIEEWNNANLNIIPKEIETEIQWIEWKDEHGNVVLECPETDCGENSCVTDIECY